MTQPRCLVPGQTYLITRRCSERRFLLRPDQNVDNLLLYCLARAVERHGIKLHAFAFLSNHYHLVLTDDPDQVRLPDFMAWFNLHVARTINCLRERRENLWAPGSYNAVVLTDEASILDKIIYTLCNPVAAGLVEEPHQWPGLISLPSALAGRPLKARHPRRFISDKQPDKIELCLEPPPCLSEHSPKKYRALITDLMTRRLTEIRQQREASGEHEVLGRRAILSQDPEGRPAKPSLAPSHKPCLACKDKKRRERLLEGLQRFRQSHREALSDWRADKREVAFPAGTYGMRRFHNARCLEGPGVFALE